MSATTKEASPDAKMPEVIPAGRVREPAPEVRLERSRKGINKRFLSLLICVIIPVLAFAVYSYSATDRYASGSSFVVRSSATGGGGGGGDFLDSITGSVSSGSTKSDSYIVRRYIESPDLVRTVDEEFDMIALFGEDRADFFQHLPVDSTFEDKVEYWNRRVISTYDHTTGILTLEVQAYAAVDAKDLSEFVMLHVRELVNNLSRSARESSYEFALSELEKSEAKLREAQQKLKEFRSINGISDPSAGANQDAMLIFELNKQIVEQKADLEVMLYGLETPGHNVKKLQLKIKALESQRDEIRKEIGAGRGGSSTVSAEVINDYEVLVLDVDIARARYTTMLDSMESARREADRQQRYLAVFSEPYVAEEAKYPRRIINVLIALIATSLAWMIVSFILQMIWDHRK